MLRIERNGVVVEIPLAVEHEGAAAVEAYVATHAPSPTRAKARPADVGGAD